ncbi:zinc finger protein 655 isoform X8 [Erinaceus europaeus]|uniref:Zinc finger protein 655 isoform X8 n=1 Tax=Erinaceus europaeus TaxID=9365 RepID=A0ABM3VYK3_ERIEU|nr:zinc finger protein 655 isoform X8 [Erinaceus europaeus]
MQDPLHGALIRGQSASPRTPFPVGPRPRKCHRDALASCGPKRPPPPPQRLWRLRPPEPGWSLSSGAVMEELLAQETAALPSRQFQGVEAHLGHLSPEPQFGQDTDMEQGLTEGLPVTKPEGITQLEQDLQVFDLENKNREALRDDCSGDK